MLQCHFSTVCVTWPTPLPSRSQAYLGPLAFSDFGFECCWDHGSLSAAGVVCCEVEVCALGWSLVRRSPTDCVCMSLIVIWCNTDLLHLQWGGKRSQTKKERKKERKKWTKIEWKKEMCHITWPTADLGFRLNFSTYCVKNLYLIHREQNRSPLKNTG